LTPLEVKVYRIIVEERYTTAEDVATSVDSSAPTVKRITYKLRDMNLIRREGSNEKGVWKRVT
jgi:predicted transcriptional regulator